MEVHHHSHKPKNWKDYISEFFMLFFAVFAGFLAESYLEYRTERHKEHDYLVSLVADLKIDSADISQKAVNIENVFLAGNRLVDLLYDDNWEALHADSIYLLSVKLYSTEILLQYADGTIDQLKNAGGFRLIKNNLIAEKIKDYIKDQSRLKSQYEGVDAQLKYVMATNSALLYSKMFTYSGDILSGRMEIELKKDKLNAIKAKSGSKFLSNNKTAFIQYSNQVYNLVGFLAVYEQMALSQKQKAIDLIKLIEKEVE